MIRFMEFFEKIIYIYLYELVDPGDLRFYSAATTSEENMTYAWIWVLLDLMLSAIMLIFGYFGYNYYQKYSRTLIVT